MSDEEQLSFLIIDFIKLLSPNFHIMKLVMAKITENRMILRNIKIQVVEILLPCVAEWLLSIEGVSMSLELYVLAKTNNFFVWYSFF